MHHDFGAIVLPFHKAITQTRRQIANKRQDFLPSVAQRRTRLCAFPQAHLSDFFQTGLHQTWPYLYLCGHMTHRAGADLLAYVLSLAFRGVLPLATRLIRFGETAPTWQTTERRFSSTSTMRCPRSWISRLGRGRVSCTLTLTRQQCGHRTRYVFAITSTSIHLSSCRCCLRIRNSPNSNDTTIRILRNLAEQKCEILRS